MENKYSERLVSVLHRSREEALRLKNSDITSEHLMLGLLGEKTCRAMALLKEWNVDVRSIRQSIESKLKLCSDKNQGDSSEILPNEDTERILRISVLESLVFKSEYTGTEHLLLAFLKDGENRPARLLHEKGLQYRQLFNRMAKRAGISDDKTETIRDGFADDDEEEDESFASPHKDSPSNTGASQSQQVKPSNDTPVLDNFGTDMTKVAAEGKLDPIVGREKEIQRLAQILSRRKKNNPVLIGEPGVGKSAIVEGLAQRIVQRKISRALFDKRVINLDMASLVAGTKYRGQFEERIKAVLNELSKNPHIILFIDEIHTLVGAGSASGSMDAANMLKPALARGELQCIGATTLDEYRKSIEKDGALERRFQKVIVDPTTADETLQILKNIKERYEDHHHMIYSDEALEACVKLTDRYINDRNFPDKAIDAMDEVGSRVHISHIVVPQSIEELETKIEKTRNEKLAAVKSQNFELAAGHRDREREYLAELENAKREWEKDISEHRETVDAEQVAEVVALMSGVPVQRIAQTENVRLREMNTALKGQVIGQDEAVDKTVKAIQRNRVGLKDPRKPIGSFMFLGPTGVGKTLLAKKIAEYLFDSEDALIRIDMSEYLEKFAVSRLIGAPPGYVGYEEGGQLTEKVRRKPYAVVLLDEIEKAHPDVFNLLLQVLDEGRLTDSLGRRIDFRNTIVIMTSNIGTRQLKDFGRGVGFHLEAGDVESDKKYSHDVIRKALERRFAPEFLNRVDDVIMFDTLSKESIHQIIDIEIKLLCKRIEGLGYRIRVTDEAKEFIASQGYDVQFGARPLKRAIQKYIEDELAEIMLVNTIEEGDLFTIGYDQENKKMTHDVQKSDAV
ncbi:MAG: ATP-dependent Clp protease ATP-binding subunit [Tannerella sp.]|nr:ATP-dependent Clp protease ATP-binding subunit [Tannerella sp.]